MQREPKEYTSQSELNSTKEKVNFKDNPEGLQVIFKLGNTHLTAEKPEYEGGSWHVEGGFNESISTFRQALDYQEIISTCQQSKYEALERYLGVEQDGAAIQELGRVLTRKGRLLAFPNCVQHKVKRFQLDDKSKPGYRKILAMFLIDPARRVLSTSNVPLQRRDWWVEELRGKNLLPELPSELREHTIDMVDFLINWEKAVEMRERLMDERSNGNKRITEELMENTFFFCEH